VNTRTIAGCIIGTLLIVVVVSIPFDQIIEVDEEGMYTSNDDNRIELTYGGPRITWVTVECNITAEINFMYPNGTWIGINNVLLASITSDKARFNYNSEHVTTIVEIVAEQPFLAHVTYTYLAVMRMSYVERFLYTLRLPA